MKVISFFNSRDEINAYYHDEIGVSTLERYHFIVALKEKTCCHWTVRILYKNKDNNKYYYITDDPFCSWNPQLILEEDARAIYPTMDFDVECL